MEERPSNTSERLKYIMDKYGLKQVDILNKCLPLCETHGVKMNKSDLSQYVSGKVEPSNKKLAILGLALDVSEAWLMGFDVPIKRNDSKPTLPPTLHRLTRCRQSVCTLSVKSQAVSLSSLRLKSKYRLICPMSMP